MCSTEKRIELSSKQSNILAKEFEVLRVTVNASLLGKTDSYLSKNIRKRALELLKEEVAKLSKEFNEKL